MGVVSQRVGDGTYVTGNASQILSEPMEFLILLDGISIYELLEARSIMEPELTARAAERATAEDLRLLAKAIEKHERNRHYLTTAIEADLSFHQAIIQAAGNRACSRMLTFIHRSVWKTLAVTSQLAKLQDLLASHKAIYAAIYKRDAEEARRQMAKHLGATKELLMKASSLPVNLRLAQTIRSVKSRGLPKREIRPRAGPKNPYHFCANGTRITANSSSEGSEAEEHGCFAGLVGSTRGRGSLPETSQSAAREAAMSGAARIPAFLVARRSCGID
jgi:DNA-binding FadR family transcriptional regulator